LKKQSQFFEIAVALIFYVKKRFEIPVFEIKPSSLCLNWKTLKTEKYLLTGNLIHCEKICRFHINTYSKPGVPHLFYLYSQKGNTFDTIPINFDLPQNSKTY